MLVEREISRAILESELPAAQAWAARHGWQLDADLEGLRVTASTLHPVDGRAVVLVGGFDDYKVLPPDWMFTAPDGTAGGPDAWPARGTLPGGSGSIFHSVGVICAHFSRRAYAAYQGPHGNWDATAWLDVHEGARAATLGQMLAVFHAHLAVSPGRRG